MINLLLADGNPLFRDVLEKILPSQEMMITGAVQTGSQGMEWVRLVRQKTLKKPDLIIINYQLPDMSGEMLCRYFYRHWQDIPCILLGNSIHWPTFSRFIDLPAKGFLIKDSLYWCRDAIKMVLSGKTFCQPDLVLNLLNYKNDTTQPKLEILSSREYEILQLLARGKTYESIVEVLHISLKTIYNIKTKAFKKLSLKSSIELSQLFGEYAQ